MYNYILSFNFVIELVNKDNPEFDFSLFCLMWYFFLKKEVIFIPAGIVGELYLLISFSRFGIININLKTFKQECIYVELKKKTTYKITKLSLLNHLFRRMKEIEYCTFFGTVFRRISFDDLS